VQKKSVRRAKLVKKSSMEHWNKIVGNKKDVRDKEKTNFDDYFK